MKQTLTMVTIASKSLDNTNYSLTRNICLRKIVPLPFFPFAMKI